MVRIAGIDRDVSGVELMLHQMPFEQSMTEVIAWLANTHTRVGADFDATVELESGKRVNVAIKEVK